MPPVSLVLPASFLPADRVLAAVSGGLDSVVLLHLLCQAGIAAGVAHVNFGLRGAESDEDEAFVARLAQESGLPFFTRKVETAGYARAQGISIQMAARDLRYAWFEELRQAQGYRYLATAHHLNDSLETALLNFVRGTGPAGLAGIAAEAGHLIRPLANCTREQIEAHAVAHNLAWREDSSNASDYYKRNFLRHRVIPLLQQLNPNLPETFRTTQLRMADAAAIVQAHAQEAAQKTLTQAAGLTRIRFGLLNAAGLPLVLHQLLSPFGFTYTQAQQIGSQLDGRHTGKQHLSPTHRLTIDRHELLISEQKAEETPAAVFINQTDSHINSPAGELTMRTFHAQQAEIVNDPKVALLDAGLLQYPLLLRPWQQGDYFRPLGMRGRKKVSDFLIDRKIPLPEKERVLVLESGGEIAWLVGYRISEAFKVKPGTLQIAELRLLT